MLHDADIIHAPSKYTHTHLVINVALFKGETRFQEIYGLDYYRELMRLLPPPAVKGMLSILSIGNILHANRIKKQVAIHPSHRLST